MAPKEEIPATPEIKRWGVVGFVLGLVPIILLAVTPPGSALLGWGIRVVLFVWAVWIGHIVTSHWSAALHTGIEQLRTTVESGGKPEEDERDQYGKRILWIPGSIGIFERAFYVLLIGLSVSGGATFIGVWITLKVAGGWQNWTKGSRFGRAYFYVSMLGNAMSAWFGVIAGLVLSYYLHP